MKNIIKIFLIIFVVSQLYSDLTGFGNYEFVFFTKNVPAQTTVYIRATNNNSPRRNENYLIASGSHTETIAIPGNHSSCYPLYAFDRGGNESPSIGYDEYLIEVTNSSKSAYFYLLALGQTFLGDKGFTYDWNTDTFYSGAYCDEEGTVSINGSYITTSSDDQAGNLLL